MPVTKITTVGGLAPSVSPRALSDAAGQKAHNLMPSISEFRPLGGDVAVAPTPYAKTIYRLARTSTGAFNTNPATGWVTAPDERSYVKGQLNDDTTERTYLTFDDSDQPPRAIDAQGADRRLGVPAPTTAPVATVNVVDEYTAEDRDADLSIAALETAKIIRAHMEPVWVGPEIAGHPSSHQVAYFGRAAPEFDPADDAQMVRVYGVNEGGNWGTEVVASYTPVDPAKFSWVYDAGLGGFKHQRRSGDAVIKGLTENAFWCIPFYGRATTYKLNRATFLPAIQALEIAGTRQFNAEAAEKLANAVDDETVGEPVKALFTDHKTKTSTVLAILDGGADANYTAQVRAFYASVPVVTEIEAEVYNLAKTVFLFAQRLRGAAASDPQAIMNGGAEIWVGGNESAAINNIVAAANQRIAEQSDGSKLVDAASLLKWLQDQFELFIPNYNRTPAPGSVTTVLQLMSNLQGVIRPAVTTLANTVRKEHWVDNAKWPKAAGQSTADLLGALKPKLAELRTASEAISRAHKKMVDEAALAVFAQAFVDREGLKFT